VPNNLYFTIELFFRLEHRHKRALAPGLRLNITLREFGDGPLEILEGFRGYLQTDGYNMYDVFEKDKGIIMLGCMAHARRMFMDAVDNDQKRSEYVLQQMQILYAIENDCKEKMLSDDERKALRQQNAVPVLQSLEKWMKEQYIQVLPKSNIGKAIAYSLERWGRLSRYTEHGMLNIDNNPVENCIRPVAIGRKNYLFCGSHEAAKRSAMLYSLFGTCKMHGINPHHWFQETLEKIAEHPINRIRELLPHYKK
jgi:transposase